MPRSGTKRLCVEEIFRLVSCDAAASYLTPRSMAIYSAANEVLITARLRRRGFLHLVAIR
jgi:hypothetical protein